MLQMSKLWHFESCSFIVTFLSDAIISYCNSNVHPHVYPASWGPETTYQIKILLFSALEGFQTAADFRFGGQLHSQLAKKWQHEDAFRQNSPPASNFNLAFRVAGGAAFSSHLHGMNTGWLVKLQEAVKLSAFTWATLQMKVLCVRAASNSIKM